MVTTEITSPTLRHWDCSSDWSHVRHFFCLRSFPISPDTCSSSLRDKNSWTKSRENSRMLTNRIPWTCFLISCISSGIDRRLLARSRLGLLQSRLQIIPPVDLLRDDVGESVSGTVPHESFVASLLRYWLDVRMESSLSQCSWMFCRVALKCLVFRSAGVFGRGAGLCSLSASTSLSSLDETISSTPFNAMGGLGRNIRRGVFGGRGVRQTRFTDDERSVIPDGSFFIKGVGTRIFRLGDEDLLPFPLVSDSFSNSLLLVPLNGIALHIVTFVFVDAIPALGQ